MTDTLVPIEIEELAAMLLEQLRKQGRMVSTAESCTGGLIAGALTAVAGSSDVVERGFVTYSNEAKAEMLDVPPHLIVQHGAVSAPVADAMARGALAKSQAQLSISVTGVAGPGQSENKPAGLVFIGVAVVCNGAPEITVEEHRFPGDRRDVRLATVQAAITLALRMAETHPPHP